MNNHDKLLKAAESLTANTLLSIHDESKGYCIKYAIPNEFTDKAGYRVINFNVLNEIAGFGFINRSML